MVERATGEGGSKGGGEKGSMDGTRSPQTKDERGARCARRIRIRLAAGPWSTASRGVPSLDLFLLRPLSTARDRRATPRSRLPASSSPRPRTTSDVVAAPREIDGARTIGIGSKPDAWNHGTVLNERALVSPSSPSLPTHRGRASTCHEPCRTTRGPVDSACERLRLDETRSSPEAHKVRYRSPSFTVPREVASRRVARRTSPVAQQRCQDVVRGRCESVAGSRFPVVARRSRTVVKGRRGKRSRDGTRSQQ